MTDTRTGRTAISTIADNDEAVSFSDDIAEILTDAKWGFLGVGALSNLGTQKFGVEIATTRDQPTQDAAHSLCKELGTLGFDPKLTEEDKVFEGGGNGIYGL